MTEENMVDANQTQTDKKEMSKKFEKLEIRLSYEEKQELASVAETEGRTVSDLVRGLIRRYVKTTSARLPQKRSWIKWVATGLLGLLIGHLATWAYTKSHQHTPIYNLEARLGNAHFSTPVLAKDGYETSFILPDEGGEFKVSIRVEERQDELSILYAEICRTTDEICENIASPILHFNPTSQAIIEINDGQKNEIFMMLRPPHK